MTDIPTVVQATQLANLLAPGFIIVAMRRSATGGTIPSLKDNVLLYGLASTVYLAAAFPLFHVSTGFELPSWLWNLVLYAVFSTIIGIFLMLETKKDWLSLLFSRIGLELPHAIPNAWDFRFSGLPQTAFLLVTLVDGTQIAGRWGGGSFASSDTKERDLLISEMWEAGDDEQPWVRLEPSRSVLICGRDIRSIEFF